MRESAIFVAAAVALVAARAGAEANHTPHSASAPRSGTGGTDVAPLPARIHARARQAWIWSEPSKKSRRLGFFRAGAALRLRDSQGRKGPGCDGGFYGVEPRGFVCLDEDTTLDPSHRYVRAMRLVLPEDSATPFSYAISNGTPMYQRLPSPAEWEKAERDFGQAGTFKQYPWNEKHERLADVRLERAGAPVPFFLKGGASVRSLHEDTLVRRIVPLGSMIAYSRAFEHAGRTWLLTSDGTVVPADRVRPYRQSHFRGTGLTSTRRLPLGWTARAERPKYVQGANGEFTASEATWAPRAIVSLDSGPDGHPVRSGTFFATTESTDGARAWIHADDVTVVAGNDRKPAGIGDDDKWIAVGIRHGTLVAYEGSKPVFATLVSPGRGGLSRPDRDPVEASTTPRGSYQIQYKYRTQTMSPQKDKPEDERTYWISEVPYAQYFRIPFALHTAYWHEDFGDWMSGGCVNLSPHDGRWLFTWTAPELPVGWHGVWAGGANGRGTAVVVER